MAVVAPPRPETSVEATLRLDGSARETAVGPKHDLLAEFHWSQRSTLGVAGIVIVVALFSGSSYLLSFFGYFRVPVQALGLSLVDILDEGVRVALLPLTVAPAAFVASAADRRLSLRLLTVGGYILLLAYVAFVNHFATPAVVVVQAAASVAIAGVVFALRRGFGASPEQRLVLGAVGLLLLTSVPVASGTLDASQIASTKQSTFLMVTTSPTLPGFTASGQDFAYSNYVLLRETDSRYWLLRLDNHAIYSIAKSDVSYVRY